MKKLAVFLSTALMILVAGCATQKPAADIEDVRATAEKGGFLHDYSDLKPGEDSTQALLTWKDENAAWGTYDKIIIEPVQIWGDASKDTVNQEDLVALADYARKAFVTAFDEAPWVEVVEKPGPGTAILRMAITDAQPTSNSTMKAISTVVPIGMIASATTEAITDKPAFAGQIQAEFMLVDAQTGKVAAKGVDRRVGGRSLSTISNSWQAAYDALDIYAKIGVYRICLFRGEKNCPKPKIGAHES